MIFVGRRLIRKEKFLGIDTSDDAVQIKPVYSMKKKFNGFEMSEFSNFILFLFFSINFY